MSDDIENITDEAAAGSNVDLPEFEQGQEQPMTDAADGQGLPATADENGEQSTSDLEAVYDVPVRLSAILGKTQMEVNNLLNLTKGAVIELDRKVGEAIDIYVNNRLVARGEVVLVEDKLGVTMTEIIQTER